MSLNIIIFVSARDYGTDVADLGQQPQLEKIMEAIESATVGSAQELSCFESQRYHIQAALMFYHLQQLIHAVQHISLISRRMPLFITKRVGSWV